MQYVRYGRGARRLAKTCCAIVVGTGLVSTSVADTMMSGDSRAGQKSEVPKVSARQKSAFQRIQANVSQLSKSDRPFHIKNSQRKVLGSVDVINFLDDVYDLHDTSGDGGFEIVDETSFDGGTNYQIQRVIDGIPVRGTNTVVTVGTDGSVLSAIGMVYRAGERNINTPNILRNTAFESCNAESRIKFVDDFDWWDTLELAFQPIDGELRLGWYAHVEDPRDLAQIECVIDAKTGRTVISKDRAGALNRKIRDATNSPNTVTVRSEGDPATGDTDVDLSYDFLGSFYSFFQARHARDGYDNNGVLMTVEVHSAVGNASNLHSVTVFSDSEPNSSYHAGNIVHGARDPDIANHEFAHNLLGNEASLSLFLESRALRESIPNMFAASMASSQLEWSTANSVWEIGEASFSNGALRYMHNPIQSGGIAWYDNRLPSYDEHRMSSVPSMMFYLLATGGVSPAASTIDRLLNVVPPITVLGIGVSDAEELIYYWMDNNFLPSHANFETAHLTMEAASLLLWPTELGKHQAVNDAWAAVGFGHPQPEYQVYWQPMCFGDSFFTISIELGAIQGGFSYRHISSWFFCWAIAVIGGT